MHTARSQRHLRIIWEELEKGMIEERRLVHATDREHIEGIAEGNHITINPIPSILDTLVHELFHRHFPQWSEPYVIARTHELVSRLTDQEVVDLYKAYQRIKQPRKRKKVIR